MEISIRNIGTSKGIIIPASLLKEYGFDDKVELQQTENGLMLLPIDKKRDGWEEAAKMVAKEDNNLSFPDILSEENFEDWKWPKEY